MEEQTNNTTNTGGLPQISRQLRRLKKDFEADVLPQLKERSHFITRGKKKRQKKTRRPRQKSAIRFSPFALTLGNSLADVQPSIPKGRPARTAIIPSQAGQLVSVFVIATVMTDPPVYVLQKIQKKTAPGFPGGGIENGETILKAAAREFQEESNGGDSASGVDIAAYNSLCIGKFTLDRAINCEQGAVVLAEIPESEIANLEAGGGTEEGEIVEELFFVTFDEVSERAKNRTILPNSVKVWDLYLDHLINQL